MYFTNWKTHQVLKALHKKWWEGENRTRGGLQITCAGRCMTILELQKETRLAVDDIREICDNIECSEYIRLFNENNITGDHNHSYIITLPGRKLYSEAVLLSQFAVYSMNVIATLTSVCAIVISLYTCEENKSNKQVYQQLQEQVLHIQKSLDSQESEQYKGIVEP